MLFTSGQRIVFIGDSVTDAGRRGEAAPYGEGYVSIARGLLLARYPELHLEVLNRGVGGDTTRHLADRWERDVVAERPDWLSVCIGINDVWRAFDGSPEHAVPLPEYEATLRALLARAREATGARLVLMEPYLIEPDRADPMRAAMDTYGEAVRRLAGESGALLVRTQAAFDDALEHTEPSDWSPDRVHPTGRGHLLLALAFLRVVGFEV